MSEPTVDVEFTIFGLRCKQCLLETEDEASTEDIFAFAVVHNAHTGYVLVGMVTSPPELASPQTLDIEWKHA